MVVALPDTQLEQISKYDEPERQMHAIYSLKYVILSEVY